MTEMRQGNMGTLTLGLSLIAVGTVGPFALILLGILSFAASAASHSMAAVMAAAGLFMILLVVTVLAGLVGQIMCFFGPLAPETKTKLGVCLGLSLLSMVLPKGLVSSLFSIGLCISYLSFLYGVCTDLEAPELTARFNSSALLGLGFFGCMMGGSFSMFFSPGLGMCLVLGGFLMGALACARYGQTIVSLAQRANFLRTSGEFPQPTHHTGFSRFEAEQPLEEAKPVLPPFEMEGSHLIELPAELPALHEASRLGETEKIGALLRPGNIDSKAQNGLTPLHIAAISGVMQAADFLLKKGAQVDETSDGGLTALYFAIQNNNAGLVGLLLQRGASLSHVNSEGRTPLHWACAVPSKRLDGQARLRMAMVLITRGADRNALDQNGNTPFQLAEMAGHQDVTAL